MRLAVLASWICIGLIACTPNCPVDSSLSNRSPEKVAAEIYCRYGYAGTDYELRTEKGEGNLEGLGEDIVSISGHAPWMKPTGQPCKCEGRLSANTKPKRRGQWFMDEKDVMFLVADPARNGYGFYRLTVAQKEGNLVILVSKEPNVADDECLQHFAEPGNRKGVSCDYYLLEKVQ